LVPSPRIHRDKDRHGKLSKEKGKDSTYLERLDGENQPSLRETISLKYIKEKELKKKRKNHELNVPWTRKFKG
jgi:hypothetical protein